MDADNNSTAPALWKLLLSFCSETQIHGLNFVGASGYVFEAIVWLLLTTVCAVFAVFDILGQIQLYMAEETGTRVRVQENLTWNFPESSCCLELAVPGRRGNWYDSRHLLVDLPSEAELFSKLQMLQSQCPFVLSRGHCPAILDRKIQPDVLIVFNAIAHLVLRMGSIEIQPIANHLQNQVVNAKDDHSGTGKVPVSEPRTRVNAEVGFVDDELTKRLLTMRAYLLHQNASFSDLLLLGGQVICKAWNIMVTGPGGWFAGSNCTANDIMWAGVEPFSSVVKLCFRLSKGSPISIKATTSEPVNIRLLVPLPYANEPRGLKASLQLWSGEGQSHSDIFFKYGSCTTEIFISISGEYTYQNLSRDPCQNEVSQRACVFRCILEQIIAVCKCLPAFGIVELRDQTTSEKMTPLCSLYLRNASSDAVETNSPYFICLRDLLQNGPANFCSRRCPRNCRKLLFQSRSTVLEADPRTCPKVMQNKIVVAKLRAQQLVYHVFEETEPNSVTALIAGLGGSIGLWLGASILAFVHIPIFIVKCVVLKLLRTARNYSAYRDRRVWMTNSSKPNANQPEAVTKQQRKIPKNERHTRTRQTRF